MKDHTNFVDEQDFVWSLMRDYVMGINHLSHMKGVTRFNKRTHRGVRLYGIAHQSRDARPLRATKKRDKRARITNKQTKRMTKRMKARVRDTLKVLLQVFKNKMTLSR